MAEEDDRDPGARRAMVDLATKAPSHRPLPPLSPRAKELQDRSATVVLGAFPQFRHPLTRSPNCGTKIPTAVRSQLGH